MCVSGLWLNESGELGGVPVPVLCEAIDRAAVGRMEVLDVMNTAVQVPVFPNLKPDAPRVGVIRCKAERLALLHGMQGKNKHAIEQSYSSVIESKLINEDEAQVIMMLHTPTKNMIHGLPWCWRCE